jgi:DNA-binding GntR family transcriptional regulator
MAPSTDEMRAIVAALRARDGAAAEAAMRVHISNILLSMEDIIAREMGTGAV